MFYQQRRAVVSNKKHIAEQWSSWTVTCTPHQQTDYTATMARELRLFPSFSIRETTFSSHFDDCATNFEDKKKKVYWLEWIYLLIAYLCNVGTSFIFLLNCWIPPSLWYESRIGVIVVKWSLVRFWAPCRHRKAPLIWRASGNIWPSASSWLERAAASLSRNPS
jgi:hypothetical protein